jgi:putative transposase
VHLLVFHRGNGEIAESMQLIEGRVAQEYNQRKSRRGAFWEDRYHATAVQTDRHLARCVIYMDLNMVRAGAVRHPREWRFSGYHELCDTAPKRKAAIDLEKLCALSGASSLDQHRAWRDDTIDRELLVSRRDAVWTTTAAVGNSQFLAEFQQSLGVAGRHKQIAGWQHGEYLRDPAVPYSAE